MTHPSPLACDRLALTQERRQRHFEVVIPQLQTLIQSVQELPDGFEFQFSADPGATALLEDFVYSERRCCSFFTILLKSDTNAVRLTLTGPEGAKTFIRSELAGLFPAA